MKPSLRWNLFYLAIMMLISVVWYEDWIYQAFLILPPQSPMWLWLQSFLFLTILFAGAWRIALVYGMGLAMLAAWVNAQKIKLLHFPLLMQDVRSFLHYPLEILSITTAGHSLLLFAILICFTLIALCYGLYQFKKFLNKPVFEPGADAHRKWISVAIYIITVLGGFAYQAVLFRDYGNYVYAESIKPTYPKDIINQSHELTLLGALAYSYAAENKSPVVSGGNSVLSSYTQKTIQRSINQRAPYVRTQASRKPNIVFMLAESTFDPNAVFYLTQPITSTLFQSGPESEEGLLNVTPVGGGTWKSEFETITGLDARFFGWAGEYTHASLAPYVQQTLATYLHHNGYGTAAFCPTSGSFFNTRSAYASYGFKTFVDRDGLELPTQFLKVKDTQISHKIVSLVPDNPRTPFYLYILLAENHSPHTCRNFPSDTDLSVRFTNETSFFQNCALNEYALRLRSTEAAYNEVIHKLQAIEAATGTPFIVVIFGDHQPMTFINSIFDGHRKPVSNKLTFYKITHSPSIKLPALNKIFHATLLPTLVSLAVADNINDAYLPENFYLYDSCGDMDDLNNCAARTIMPAIYKNYILFRWKQ